MTDNAGVVSAGTTRPRASRLRRLWRRLVGHQMFLTGGTVCGVFLLMGLGADFIAPSDPNAMSVMTRFKPPSLEHLMGTDNFGRDVFARVVHGSRISLAIGAAVAVLTTLIGGGIGLAAGYFRRLDSATITVMDALMAFPTILLAIGISTALGPSTMNAVIALTVVYTPRMARIVRSSVIVVSRLDYVESARAIGAGDGRILVRHILPNCVAPIVVQVTFVFAYAVLAEAILSFLGLGAPPPVTSWGVIIAEGRQYLRTAWWICVFPGLAITITVLGLNLLGDSLRDVLDPRIRIQSG